MIPAAIFEYQAVIRCLDGQFADGLAGAQRPRLSLHRPKEARDQEVGAEFIRVRSSRCPRWWRFFLIWLLLNLATIKPLRWLAIAPLYG